jgi:hypothetical protein
VTDRSSFVVEIGVGTQRPAVRPFARDAAYIGLDVDPKLLTLGAARLIAADATRLPFADHSVDHIVACNVFGDIGLGFGFEEIVGRDPRRYAEHVQRLVARGALEELEVLRTRVRTMTRAVDATKLSILREAARVLRRGGGVIVVETLTPKFAQEWITGLTGGRANEPAALAGIEIQCRAVSTHNRRRRYCVPSELTNRSLMVWVLNPGPAH